jgi:hypothetical protein
MDATNNIATDLFYKIRSRFKGLKLGDSGGTITINPEDARFFDFDYMEGETAIGHVSISLAEQNSLKVYFSTGITESMDGKQKTNWYGFLKELRQFAKRRLMAFDTRDIAKDNLDQRDYEFLSQHNQPKDQQNTVVKPVGESIMSESALYGSKTVSYQKLMDTRLIIKHNQAVMDDAAPGARSRNISGLFVENQDGERFKYPFIHLAGARAMQRHVANGGVPYDDIGKSIVNMSEEIAQLKSFGNYVVRNDLMNSDTNNVVERSAEQLNRLREQIKAMSKQGHYEQYRESFQAQTQEEVPQEFVEEFTEKFTVKNFKEDIKNVFPVLYRLMKESDIGYDDIVAMTTTEQDAVEDVELDEHNEFDRFESWVMGLGEDSAIASRDPEEQQTAKQELQELVGQSFAVGVDGSNAIESLKGIIEDPTLFKQIKEAATQDPETDARSLVKDWLESNAPDALEGLDFGDFEEQPAMDAEEVPQEAADGPNKSDVPAYLRKQKGEDPMTLKDLEDEKTKSPTSSAGLARRKQELGMGEADNEPEEKDDDPPFDPDPKSNFKKPNNPNRTGQDSAKALAQQGMKKAMNVQELAEFIHSFYDQETGTFPKGPEGVAIMVGKKFGEQAEQVARAMVERMAPQQADPQIAELSRIRELSGMSEASAGFKEGDKVVVGGKNPATVVGQDGDTYFVQVDGQSGSMAVPASQLSAPKAATSPFKRGDKVMYKGVPVTYIRPFGQGNEQSYVTVASGSDELVNTAELTKEAVQSDEISRLKELLRF